MNYTFVLFVCTFGQVSAFDKFQLILPVHSNNVTKNLTGHRMHVEGPQIYQMNRHINSFQNFNLGRDSEDGI